MIKFLETAAKITLMLYIFSCAIHRELINPISFNEAAMAFWAGWKVGMVFLVVAAIFARKEK